METSRSALLAQQTAETDKPAVTTDAPNWRDAFEDADQFPQKPNQGRRKVSAGFSYYPRLLSIPQAVAYSNESRATLYAENKSGKISFVKIGGRTVVTHEELQRWFMAHSEPAAA